MSSTPESCERTIKRAITYLAKQQQADGTFVLQTASQTTQKNHAFNDTFLPHLVLLDCLQNVPDATAQRIGQKLIPWITTHLQQQNVAQTFAGQNTYEVFYALTVLYEYSAKNVDQTLIVAAIHHLVAQETQPGGPYHNAAQRNAALDFATNLVITRFLRHVADPLPNLETYIQKTKPAQTDWLLDLHIQALYGHTTPTATELAVVIDTQNDDGSWFDTPSSAQTSWETSPLLATARLVRLLCQVSASPTPKYDKPPSDSIELKAAKIAAQAYPGSVNRTLETLLNRIAQADTGQEIGPLATRFSATLPQTYPSVAESVLQALGIANLFAWVAYTVYDDFLDGESMPPLLPAANIAMRQSILLFEKAVDDLAFHALVRTTFDNMDQINSWEVTNCQFLTKDGVVYFGNLPDYGDLHALFQRSLSHSLPVIGTLVAAGVPIGSKQSRQVHEAFRQYLVIRQLSDDLHDWKEDLSTGRITYVIARMCEDMKLKPGPKRLTRLMPIMERHFWEYTLHEIDAEIIRRAQLAKTLMEESGVTTCQDVITILVERIEAIAHRTEAEQQDASRFLASYRAHPVTAK